VPIVTVAVMALFYVLIPGALVLFYRSRHVTLTCQARDPVERWTDRCPLPVLGAVLQLAYSAFVLLMLLPQFGRAFFFFGVVITGIPAQGIWASSAAFLAWAAVGFYRLDRRAWRAYVSFVVLFGASAPVSFARLDLLDYYRAAGLPEAQLAQIRSSPLMQGGHLLWLALLSCAALVGYLFYIRRFFSGNPAPVARTNSPPAGA
jgi:hypothetical protein